MQNEGSQVHVPKYDLAVTALQTIHTGVLKQAVYVAVLITRFISGVLI